MTHLLKRNSGLMRFYTRNVTHQVWKKVVAQDEDFVQNYMNATQEWCSLNHALYKKPDDLVALVIIDETDINTQMIDKLAESGVDQVCFVVPQSRSVSGVTEQIAAIHQSGSVSFSTIDITALENATTPVFIPEGCWFTVLTIGESILPTSLDFILPNQPSSVAANIAAVYFDHSCSHSNLSNRLRLKPSFDKSALQTSDYIANAIWMSSLHFNITEAISSVINTGSVSKLLLDIESQVSSRPIIGFELSEQKNTNHLVADVANASSEQTSKPLVSVIIPTRNQHEVLKAAVDSALKTHYKQLELIVVDNQSTEATTLEYLRWLEEQKLATVLRYPHEFNYSAINNFAVERASGELICFLNNDIEAITTDWLQKLVHYAKQPEIGAVGAKLLYPNESIQHAGVVVGMNGVADHVFKGIGAKTVTNINELNHSRRVTAVTAACLVVKKQAFELVGGFNEMHLAVAFNDVDLCLKLTQAGYQNIWVHDAILFHHESISRGFDGSNEKRLRFESEANYMRETWKLGNGYVDPHANPNWCKAIDAMRQ